MILMQPNNKYNKDNDSECKNIILALFDIKFKITVPKGTNSTQAASKSQNMQSDLTNRCISLLP